MSIASINPLDNKTIRKFKEDRDHEIEQKLRRAEEASIFLRKEAIPIRTKRLRDLADTLDHKKHDLAALITLEMGKPIKESRAEIEKCAWVCRYYADNAKLFLKDEPVKTEASNSFITYEPLGVVLAIMPWNFPFWQVFRFAAPALAAGNAIILKHASNVPQCSLAIDELVLNAHFPEGSLQSVLMAPKRVSKLIADPVIKAVTLTGSERAGTSVGVAAGKAIKKCVMELGGSDPFIILDDANLKRAAEVAVRSRMINTGQSCIAAKRFIAVESVFEVFSNLVQEEVAKLKLGNPNEESTDLGPLAREDLARSVIKQIRQSKRKGAMVLCGGDRPKMRGAFVNPTILTGVRSGMPAFDDEIFGPVVSLVKAKDEAEAIELANKTKYGLGASLWTEDPEKALRLQKKIRAGSVFINEMVKSDPRLPFGGIKQSGYGRELSHHGIKEFVNIKTVYVQ